MAASAVGSAAKELGRLLVEEAKFLYGVKDKVEELQQELSWMQVFLRDVDKKQHHDELIRMWVSQIRDFAYEAEDIVEKYIHGVSQRSKDRIWNTLTKQFPRILSNASALHEVGSDIDKLTLKISKLNKRLKSYGVRIDHLDDSHYISRIRDLRETYSNTVDKDLIKREKDVEELVTELRDPNPARKIVGISGMAGLGKSTLAREVCRDKRINDFFTHLVWIYVSQQPQTERIQKEMASLDSTSGDKRCLIVLDDIWDQSTGLLKRLFQPILSDSTSRILATARNEEVVHKLDQKAIIVKPTKLSDDESWVLLRKKALIQVDDLAKDPELKRVGEKMLEHCKGLPLAIVALGGILATKEKTVQEWEDVEKHIDSYFTKNVDQEDDGMGIGEVLELSYYELAFYLKPCFLYFGYFPENCNIRTRTLYQLWQAEGFIRAPEKNKSKAVSSYDIAEQYLKELVKRCMVEVEEVYGNGGIKTCRMHDIMRALCLKKSKEEKFWEVVTADDLQMSSYGGSDSSRQVWTTHRVVVHLRDDKLADSFFGTLEQDALQLRSLSLVLPQNCNLVKFGIGFSKMCKAFRLVRVLCLEGAEIKKLPDELGNCIHLRYLSFRLIQESEVPSVVWKLAYLQTLDLQYNDKGLMISNKLRKLKRLVHLYLPETYKARTKLRFSQPRQIETLVNIDLKDLHSDDLGNMTNLRMLSLNKTSMDVEGLSLVLKSQMITSRLLDNPISTLDINAEVINQDAVILGLSKDASIKMLKISGMIKPSLESIVFPHTIVSLELYGTQVQGDCIPDIKISGLKELHLKEKAIRGKKIVLSSECFPELKKLTLEWPASSELSEVEGALPYLCYFSIRCPRELEAHISIALHHNTNFRRIEHVGTSESDRDGGERNPGRKNATALWRSCPRFACKG